MSLMAGRSLMLSCIQPVKSRLPSPGYPGSETWWFLVRRHVFSIILMLQDTYCRTIDHMTESIRAWTTSCTWGVLTIYKLSLQAGRRVTLHRLSITFEADGWLLKDKPASMMPVN